jgi:hypothetical protein
MMQEEIKSENVEVKKVARVSTVNIARGSC